MSVHRVRERWNRAHVHAERTWNVRRVHIVVADDLQRRDAVQDGADRPDVDPAVGKPQRPRHIEGVRSRHGGGEQKNGNKNGLFQGPSLPHDFPAQAQEGGTVLSIV